MANRPCNEVCTFMGNYGIMGLSMYGSWRVDTMDAHKALITDIFNNATLVEVPFFQRSYVWKEDLWSRFLEDMEYVVKTNKTHFLGPIILKSGKNPGPDDLFSTRKVVVDGQQRLTTFLIFMKVLCLKLNQTLSFDCQFRIMGQMIALRHGRNDLESFEAVMATEQALPLKVPSHGSKIIEAFNYFVDRMDPRKLDIMSIRRNIQFVKIDLDANEDEQQIFDTINSLGVNLTTSELLKNYFFTHDTVDEYETIWASVFEKDDDTKAYWDTEIETGRIKRALIDMFFDAYFQLFVQDKQYNISVEDKLMYARVDNLAQSYQHFISRHCDGNKNVVLGPMREYALCFMQNFRPEQCNMNVPHTFGIERMNVIIWGLKNTTLIPYVLYITKNVPDQAERNKMYGILESFIIRRIIAHAPTKNYNNLFTAMIANGVQDGDMLLTRLKNSSDTSTYIPSDQELYNGFTQAKLINLQAKGILYLMESKIRPVDSATVLLGFSHYSLEHLMPKKWRNHWPPCQSDELAQERDAHLLTLGNLAMIPQALNASIRDAQWTIKKAGKGTRPGLTLCAWGIHTLYDALQQEIWDETQITLRANWLYQQAKTIWKL